MQTPYQVACVQVLICIYMFAYTYVFVYTWLDVEKVVSAHFF